MMSEQIHSESKAVPIPQHASRNLRFTAMTDPKSLESRSLSNSPTNLVSSPSRPTRKVSFSDVVVTSTRIEKEPSLPEAVPESGCEHVTMVSCHSESPVDGMAHCIQVRLLESHDDEVLKDSPLLTSSLPIFEVKLGMLKQATLYRMEFNVPDDLPVGEVELLRFITDAPGCVSAPVNVGATVDLLSCEPCESEPGHHLVLKVATTRQPRVNELFTLRLVEQPEIAIHLILHGLSLGRGQGTPFLRAGIHRIAENSDYEDSDEFTEWPGFNHAHEDEEDEENEGHTGSELPKDTPNANQGDKQDALNDLEAI
ncbi:hypothetical protein D915_001534 [Fasciola hepatica]|uniref:Adipose-secreted signaling protein n=1 Tax=Fasciola hepatica TaxID=6192 RepID=A0A4E0RX07_FASHE|nr:hypothetical protein D915_001534 [Fasciola hepatica]